VILGDIGDIGAVVVWFGVILGGIGAMLGCVLVFSVYLCCHLDGNTGWQQWYCYDSEAIRCKNGTFWEMSHLTLTPLPLSQCHARSDLQLFRGAGRTKYNNY
jgi:hypothetical protein